MMDSYGLVGVVVLVVGTIVFLKWQISRMHAEEKERSKSPFTRKMLRPAGESLRLKIDQIRDEMDEALMMLIVAVLVPSIMVALVDFKTSSVATLLVVGVAMVVMVYTNWKKLRVFRDELRNHRLGYDGERYVAAELNELMLQGWRVYHDFIVDDKPGGAETDFNIDHIAVSERGVFVFETKAIRKPLRGLNEGEENHRVKVQDGKLFLPTGLVTGKPIRQAEQNAEWVSKWLTVSGGKKIRVIPVLVIPGWFIEQDREGVRVLNEKMLLSVLPTLGDEGALGGTEVAVICDRIEDKSRNVEGAA